MLECDDAGEPSEAQASSPHSLPHSHLHLLLRASRLLPLPSTEALELGKLNRLSHPSPLTSKAVAMRVNATGCSAPVLDRNRMNTHKHLSQLIVSAVDHDIPTPV